MSFPVVSDIEPEVLTPEFIEPETDPDAPVVPAFISELVELETDPDVPTVPEVLIPEFIEPETDPDVPVVPELFQFPELFIPVGPELNTQLPLKSLLP